MPFYVVDTIQTYRVKYVVKANSVEDAFDEVVMLDSSNPDNHFESFTEDYLGYHIIEGQEIDDDMLNSMKDDIANGNDTGPGHVREIVYK